MFSIRQSTAISERIGDAGFGADGNSPVASDAYHILVVDDDHLVRQLIVHALERRPQLHLDQAGSLAEALALVSAHTYDLVLSDIRMESAATGVELLRAVKKCSPSTAVILLTAHGTLPTAVHALRERADNFLLKPLSMAELEASVSAVLERRATAAGQQLTLERVVGTLQRLLTDKPAPPVPDAPHIPSCAPRFLTAGSIRLDAYQHRVTVSDRPVDLTPSEFTILHVLLRANRHVVTFEQLVAETHQLQTSRESARDLIASHIRNLRRKLGSSARRLMNVRGIGYCLLGEDA